MNSSSLILDFDNSEDHKRKGFLAKSQLENQDIWVSFPEKLKANPIVERYLSAFDTMVQQKIHNAYPLPRISITAGDVDTTVSKCIHELRISDASFNDAIMRQRQIFSEHNFVLGTCRVQAKHVKKEPRSSSREDLPWLLDKSKVRVIKSYDARVVSDEGREYGIEFYDDDTSVVEATLAKEYFRGFPEEVEPETEFWIMIYKLAGSPESRFSAWPVSEYWHPSWLEG